MTALYVLQEWEQADDLVGSWITIGVFSSESIARDRYASYMRRLGRRVPGGEPIGLFDDYHRLVPIIVNSEIDAEIER